MLDIIGRHHAGRLVADEASAGKVQVTLRTPVPPLYAPNSYHTAVVCTNTHNNYNCNNNYNDHYNYLKSEVQNITIMKQNVRLSTDTLPPS